MTVSLTIDLGFGFTLNATDFDGNPRLSCRVYGINAPELSTQAGKDARACALTILPVGSLVTVLSHGWDKYGGRFLGVITLASGDTFGDEMIGSGHAQPYFGTGPKP